MWPILQVSDLLMILHTTFRSYFVESLLIFTVRTEIGFGSKNVWWTKIARARDGNSILPATCEDGEFRHTARPSSPSDAIIVTTLNFLTTHHSNLVKIVCASSNSLKIVSLLPSDLSVIELPYSFTQCRNP